MHRFVVVVALLAAPAALAHGDEPHAHAPPAKTAPAPPKSADHEHAAPHGGVVVDVAKDLHVEVVFAADGVAAWFYDGAFAPIPAPAEAKLTLVAGKETRKLALAPPAAPAPPDHLWVATPLPVDGKVVALVQATVGGKPRTARAERPAAAPSTGASSQPAHAH
jgi:hypothetical protein